MRATRRSTRSPTSAAPCGRTTTRSSLRAARCGYAEAAAKITRGILDAASMFQGYRLPELFSGHAREALGFPVQYLGVNIPQAWAAGSSFLMLQVLLGLRPDAPRGRLIVAPALPGWLAWLDVENLQVGQARVSFSCYRDAARSRVEVRKVDGPLIVIPSDTDDSSRSDT